MTKQRSLFEGCSFDEVLKPLSAVKVLELTKIHNYETGERIKVKNPPMQKK